MKLERAHGIRCICTDLARSDYGCSSRMHVSKLHCRVAYLLQGRRVVLLHSPLSGSGSSPHPILPFAVSGCIVGAVYRARGYRLNPLMSTNSKRLSLFQTLIFYLRIEWSVLSGVNHCFSSRTFAPFTGNSHTPAAIPPSKSAPFLTKKMSLSRPCEMWTHVAE